MKDDIDALKRNLKELIFQELKITHIAPEDFSNEEPLFTELLGLDSIDAVEVVYLVEKNYGVAMKDMQEARPALESINTLAVFIEARTN